MLKNTNADYAIVAKGFHWLMFPMLGFMMVAGILLEDMPSEAEKAASTGMHKSFGMLMLMLVVLRLLWRVLNAAPQDPEGTPAIQALIARVTYVALYVLMLVQPLTGILMSQSAGYPVNFFGLYELPVLLGKDPSLAEFFHGAHDTIWILLLLVVIIHAGGMLYHHFIVKDDVLLRMGFRPDCESCKDYESCKGC